MKGKATALYIGTDSQIPEYLAEHEGYLVDAVSPHNLSQITEYLRYDEDTRGVATDNLEGDARLIMMDIRMLEGVKDFSSLADKIIEKKLKGESLDEFSDDMSKEIIRVIELSPEKLSVLLRDEKNNNIKIEDARNTKRYFEYIKSIMSSMSLRVLLGDEKYEFIVKYIEQMKKEANERRAHSRFASGDNRDLLEGSEQWKPMFMLTSNQELSAMTNPENVRVEYQQLYLMQKLMNDFGIDVNIPGVVNIRSEYDVRLSSNLLKGVETTRGKIKEVIEKRLRGEKIDISDDMSAKILTIINTLGIELNSSPDTVRLIIDKMEIGDMLTVEELEQITSLVGRVQKNATKEEKKENNGKKDESKEQKRTTPPRLMIVGEDIQGDEELSNLQQSILEKIIKESGIGMKGFEIRTGLTTDNARSIVDPGKVVSTINWLDIFANPNNTKNIRIEEAMLRALNMADVLDVDGSVMAHGLRTSLLLGDYLKFMARDMDWKGVESALPEQSVHRYKITEKEIEDIREAAYWHDIGKLLNVEDLGIMNFSASLQTNAGRIMSEVADDSRKHHAEIGSHTIDYIRSQFSGSRKSLDYASNMALYHQEYINDDPNRSVGYSKDGQHHDALVPLEAQYMMIVDVFDAIVSNRNYNKKTTLEETIEIMTKQGGIRIMQEDESNPGKYKPVQFKSLCIGKNIKFELEEGAISRASLHFNPVLLKGFFEYLQAETQKENSFVKFENAPVQMRDGYRKVVTGIGARDFSRSVIHRDSEDKKITVREIEQDLIRQKVIEFRMTLKSFNQLASTASAEQKEAIRTQLIHIRDEILAAAQSVGKSTLKWVLKNIDVKEQEWDKVPAR